MSGLVVDILIVFDWFVLTYFLVLNSSYLALIGVAARTTRRDLTRPAAAQYDDVFANPLAPPISIVIGAHNEEMCIAESVRAALGLRYPELEVVVVDDGSTDATFEILEREFDLVEAAPAAEVDVPTIGAVISMHVAPEGTPLTVIRKVGAGRRSDALNAGINVARHELICCVDADSLLEHDALLKVVKPFVDDPRRVIATGGGVRAVNGTGVYRGQLGETRQPRNWWVRIQIIEYLRSFLLGRAGWSQAGGLLIISGAFGVYRRDVLIAVGGFDTDSLGEDADMVVSMHRWARDTGLDHRILFVPEANCWTEVPNTRRVLSRQRRRWSHGLGQVLWKHRVMFLRPKYGVVGMVSLPYWFLFELIGPVIELVGLLAVVGGLWFGVIDVPFALLIAAAALLYGFVVSVSALVVEEFSFHRYRRWRDLWVSIAASALENIGFRQLHAWWRLRGLWSFLRRSEPPWGQMERAGFTTETEAAT